VYRQYDHTVQAHTVIPPGLGSAVLRLDGTRKGLALTTDCNPSYCAADPRAGARIAVAEAARNLACRGAVPIAVTDCLNFGSPERPDVYWQLSESVEGLAEACRVLEIPVVSGNVSLYNETGGAPIAPTPIVGMVGLLENVGVAVPSAFGAEGLEVFLLGAQRAELARSEYAAVVHGLADGPAPGLDLSFERALHDLLRDLAEGGLVRSAQDCSDGGLAIALAECAMHQGIGFVGDPGALRALVSQARGRADLALFSEAQSRVVVACAPASADELRRRTGKAKVPLLRLGTTGGREFLWGDAVRLSVQQMREVWMSAFERHIAGASLNAA
jgi:phosphoribosylformylglycinamidine synthase